MDLANAPGGKFQVPPLLAGRFLRQRRREFYFLYLLLIFRIHRFRAATSSFDRDSVSAAEFVEIGIGSGQMVWHDAGWSIDFIDRFARPRRHLGLRIVDKVDRAN